MLKGDVMCSPRVSIIILNWNNWRDTIECLDSLLQISYKCYDVIIIDNGSTDGSQREIEKYIENKMVHSRTILDYDPIGHSKQYKNKYINILVINNQNNCGFAKGNNIGISYAIRVFCPEYILLLNNDTTVEKQFLTELIKTAESGEDIGICGSKLLNAYAPNIIDSTGHIISWGRIVDRGHGEFDIGQYDNKMDVIGAMAAAALYKRTMLESIGLFDESFFTTYEDAELSWRALVNGWKAKYCPMSIVYHKRGRTIKRSDEITGKMMLLSIRNSTTTVNRYGSLLQKFLFKFILIKNGIMIIIGTTFGKNKYDVKKILILIILSIFKY